MLKRLVIYSSVILCAFSILACDPLTVHKVTTTIFDGVPSMPSPEQYCADYHQVKSKEEIEAAKAQHNQQGTTVKGSIHLPYAEKKCDGCHDKNQQSGLIKPKEQLCFVCHPKIIDQYWVHGPASLGACLECHDPHSSSGYPALLKSDKVEVCLKCHKEQRTAEGLHGRSSAVGIVCSDCHNPHAGAVQFFLR